MNRSVEHLPREKIALALRSERQKAWPDEDWSGITDPKTRRRLQNRLNQRARRIKNKPVDRSRERKTNSKECSKPPKNAIAKKDQLETQPSHATTNFPSLAEIASVHILSSSTATKNRLAVLEQMALQHYAMGSPRTDLLLNIISLNFTKALMENKRILGLNSDQLHNDDAISPFNTAGPRHTTCLDALPTSLQPTLIQLSIPHHPWLDLLPIPQMRDNLILAGDFEGEDQLCVDMKGTGSLQPESGIIVWGDPWDPAGWEVSARFVRSWGWVMRDCLDLALSTNKWRAQRNEKPLFRVETVNKTFLR